MKLIIKGDERKIKRLFKELKLRVKRDGLKASIGEAKKAEVKSELTAKDIIELIKGITDVKDLEQYKSDERKTVKKAYDDKLKELTPEE